MPVLSPSQLELYKLCPRRWAYTYLLGLREPPTKATLAGTKIHDILERYLRDGVIPDKNETWEDIKIGEIAYEMTKHLPPRGSVKQTETKLNFEVSGVTYTGRIDAVHEGIVYDHKSTSSFRYLKDEETLQTDLQALIYARWYDKDGTLQWTFGNTKNSKARKTQLPVLRTEVHERFDRIVTPLAKEVLQHYEDGDIGKCRKNLQACDKFPPAGCPNRKDCMSTPEIKNGMSLAEKIAARKALAAQGVQEITKLTEEAGGYEKEFVPGAALNEDIINPPETVAKKKRAKKDPEKFDYVKVIEDIKVVEDINKVIESLDVDRVIEAHKTPTGFAIGRLYIDCLPTNTSNVVWAHDLIARAAETSRNDLQLHHVMLADFGKGAGTLAAQLREDIKSMGFIEHLVLQARTAEGRAVQQELCALAEHVIVGL